MHKRDRIHYSELLSYLWSKTSTTFTPIVYIMVSGVFMMALFQNEGLEFKRVL